MIAKILRYCAGIVCAVANIALHVNHVAFEAERDARRIFKHRSPKTLQPDTTHESMVARRDVLAS